MKKQLSLKKANQAIEIILNRLEIIDLTKTELIRALKSKTADLEVASQIDCAMKNGKVKFIITRDKKGYKYSTIDVLNPDELINTELQ